MVLWGAIVGGLLVAVIVSVVLYLQLGDKDGSSSGRDNGHGPDKIASARRAEPATNPGCRPRCSGRQCGPDGCGGSCGSCAGQQRCVSHRCVAHPPRRKDVCQAMTGQWKGVYHLDLKGHRRVKHTLAGRVWGTEDNCEAKFRIEWWKYHATEHFHVRINGRDVSFQGYRVESSVPCATDRFQGRLAPTHDAFEGFMVDEKGRHSSKIRLWKP